MALKKGPDGVLMDEIAPGALLDYEFEWHLDEGDSVASSEWAATAGGQVSDAALANNVARVYVQCDTAGTVFTVTNTITTQQGRVDARSIRFQCRVR